MIKSSTANANQELAGFRIFRSQDNIFIPLEARNEFDEKFVMHTLYEMWRARLEIVGLNETEELLRKANLLGQMSLAQVIQKVMHRGRQSTWRTLSLPPERLVYKLPTRSGRRDIALVLLDKRCQVDEERNKYLEVLYDLSGWRVAGRDFRAEVILGYTDDSNLKTTEALQFLRPFIPEEIEFRRADVFPAPFALRGKGRQII